MLIQVPVDNYKLHGVSSDKHSLFRGWIRLKVRGKTSHTEIYTDIRSRVPKCFCMIFPKQCSSPTTPSKILQNVGDITNQQSTSQVISIKATNSRFFEVGGWTRRCGKCRTETKAYRLPYSKCAMLLHGEFEILP